ncbi:MAG: ABC-F family ATP-binding cassette domain-containing protein [Clostridia bacterium]|nr:ABC-F family ATP-binding cassette domain-containing protein [Clostridia bacterium]
MGVINFDQVTKSYGDNLILDNISFEIFENEKVALIGNNGTGKTTLLNLINQYIDFEKGNISIQNGYTVSYLKQIHDELTELNGLDMLYSAFNHIDELQEKMNEAHRILSEHPDDIEVLKQYGRLHDKFEFMGGYNIKEKISKIITGLSIPEKVLKTRFYNMSGGEQTLTMLGKALLSAPDILLLDEPTNHLDMDACIWLETYIREYKGIVLYVSHDRYFINRTADKVIEISFNKTNIYKGNYESYLIQKREEQERHLKLYERQIKETDRLMETARQMRNYGTEIAIKRAKNLEKRIEKMEKVDKPVTEKTLTFAFKEIDKIGYEVIKATNISKSYQDNLILDNVNFLIKSDDRVGVIGPNGAGKSTLIKLITSRELPDHGEVKLGKSVKYAYLEQEVIFENTEHTVLEEVCDKLKLTIQSGRNLLGKYLFSNEDVFKQIKVLSGGEKSRLRLLLEMQNDVNLLILDEPTNHLDISSREQLEEAVSLFQGTMLFISHDRHFINKFAKRIFEVKDRHVTLFEGNYDFYSKEIEEKKLNREIVENNEVKAAKSFGKSKRVATFTIKQLERTIEQLENDIRNTDQDIISHASDYKALGELTYQRESLSQELDEAMDKWMRLSEEANEDS